MRHAKARRRFRRGLYDIGDDVNVPLICPPRQAAKANGGRHSAVETKSLDRGWAPAERTEAVSVAACRLCAEARSSTCADALVPKLADFGDDAAMPVIYPACQIARFTAAPGSPGERVLAWVAQAPPAASIQSA